MYFQDQTAVNVKKDSVKQIGRSFIMQQKNAPKHTKTTKQGARSERF